MEVAKHMEEMIIGTSLAGLLTLGAVGTFAMFFWHITIIILMLKVGRLTFFI